MNVSLASNLTQNLILPIWKDRNLAVIDHYFSKDAEVRTTFLSGTGPDAIKQSISDTFKAFPNFQLKLNDIVEQNNKLTFIWSAIADHKGDILNIKPTGKTLQFHGIVFGEIEKGLIVKYDSHSNIPQVLYNSIQESKNTTFTTRSTLLHHENYEKELSEVLFLIAKLTGVRLSCRELESLNLWVKGYSIKETARQLGGLSAKTVQVFRNNIRKKFNVSSYQQLIDLLQEHRLLSLFIYT